jgi:hypothetical protein
VVFNYYRNSLALGLINAGLFRADCGHFGRAPWLPLISDGTDSSAANHDRRIALTRHLGFRPVTAC